MENLFRFLLKYHLFLVFIALEIFALVLINKTSDYRGALMASKIDLFKGAINVQTTKLGNYLILKRDNENLVEENITLKRQIEHYKTLFEETNVDTIATEFDYIPAKVVENSLNMSINRIIITSGSKQGVEKNMGVISSDGIVGTVESVSDNFSTIKSLLSTSRGINAKIARTGLYAPLSWDGNDIRHVDMIDISPQTSIVVGDTIITSGHSMTFPEGIIIGTISDFELDKGNFKVKVLLSNDFRSLNNVYVIKSEKKSELDSLKTL